MNIDTSLNLVTGLGVMTVASCSQCGDTDSQGGETGTISDEVASEQDAQVGSGK